jgi:hypothetical protein
MTEQDDEGFAQRWSRLKQEAREAEERTKAPPPAAAAAPAEGKTKQKDEAKKEEKPFDPADLPPVESLTKDSDYSPFMRAEVPEELRQKALRRLWASDPVLSSPELFDMHTLDYNAVPTFPEGVRTAFRVGRGILDALELEAEEKAAAAAKAGQGEDTARTDESHGDKSPAQPSNAAPQQDDLTEIKNSRAKKT